MSQHNPWVTITHPETGGTYECPKSSLPHYKSLGWRRVTKQSSTEAPATAADSTSTPRKSGTSKKKEQRNG